jgi:hypothetical protein
MEHDGQPPDPASAAAVVVRALEDIDGSDEEHRNALLMDLLCAAWGSVWARRQ